ncbi:MAG: SUMF1/EgtB/PvdO family nonheme iron enzyme [Chloroflexi bacterium]|nr:SUMF1/EgtB/PvdO family nonheme iron enzyme [Chloroflexota bacterium]
MRCRAHPNGNRVVRGGSFINNRRNARCAYRNRNDPNNLNRNQGFRVVVSHIFFRIALLQDVIASRRRSSSRAAAYRDQAAKQSPRWQGDCFARLDTQRTLLDHRSQ